MESFQMRTAHIPEWTSVQCAECQALHKLLKIEQRAQKMALHQWGSRQQRPCSKVLI